MPIRGASWAAAFASLLAAGAQSPVTPHASVTWAWSGGVTSGSAVVKARASAGRVLLWLELARDGTPAASPRRVEVMADEDGPDRFRRAFDAVMASPTQGPLYRSVPIAYTWDDHDFGGNDADASSDARPAALAVYRQFVPHYPLSGDGPTGIHQAFTIGRVRVVMTDSRSQRGPSRGDSRTRTMLGAAQLAWVKNELSASGAAPLVIWVNTVPWIASPASGSDNWGSYAREREAIANHIDRLGLTRRLTMLSGDAHMMAIDDGTHANYATGAGRGLRGFVVMHAAPLDRSTSVKGGPYSHGVSQHRGQFGLVDITDDGTTIRVELRGRDRAGAPIEGMRLVLECVNVTCEIKR